MGPPHEPDRPAMAGEVAVRYDVGADEPPSLALVRVVAALANEAPTAIEPLYELVDLDALDRLLASAERPFTTPTRVVVDIGRYTIAIGEMEVVAVDPTGGPDDRRFGPTEHR